jgi:Ca2+-transporting ATPase/DNA polymerase kappa
VYHSAPKEQKSLGAQRTFRALSAKDELITKCKDLCDEVATRLQKKGKKGKKVTLFLKTAEFELRSKTTTARNYVDSSEDIFPLAKYVPFAIAILCQLQT